MRADGSLPQGTVTFLFSDIEGSTRLPQDRGSEYAEMLAGRREALRAECGSAMSI
jgi:class 3 adenylate cyclase